MIFSDDCYQKDTCWKYQTKEDCECKTSNIFCPKLFRLDYLFDAALLSHKQRVRIPLLLDEDGTDREAFNLLKEIELNIDSFVSEGKHLYIHSTTCGNGKTAWSLRLLQAYFSNIWYKSDLRCRALFISVPRYLQALKDSINTPSEYVNHIKSNILTADIVVFDEIGTKVATPFELENLLNMINSRIDLGKSNIYTSNMRDFEVKEKLGERLYSRVLNLSTCLEFSGADKRSLEKMR